MNWSTSVRAGPTSDSYKETVVHDLARAGIVSLGPHLVSPCPEDRRCSMVGRNSTETERMHVFRFCNKETVARDVSVIVVRVGTASLTCCSTIQRCLNDYRYTDGKAARAERGHKRVQWVINVDY